MKYITLLFLLFSSIGFAQTIEVNKDIHVKKLTDKAYLYTAWADVGSWGRVGSNGLILVDKDRAYLFDTPMHETQTIELTDWIRTNLKARIVGFVPGHWHSDCVGGMDYLNRQGVKTYADKQTNEILKKKGLPQAKSSFSDSVVLKLNDIEIKCYYLGGGHATDNIVTWIPSEKILFGGCMLKDTLTTGLGNTADAAPLNEWLQTVQSVGKKFKQAKIVIPGHGEIGGLEIVEHTQKILIKNLPKK